jgi:hypothetical protein
MRRILRVLADVSWMTAAHYEGAIRTTPADLVAGWATATYLNSGGAAELLGRVYGIGEDELVIASTLICDGFGLETAIEMALVTA